MGLYMMPELYDWFVSEHAAYPKNLIWVKVVLGIKGSRHTISIDHRIGTK